jgi:hypothetical protein
MADYRRVGVRASLEGASEKPEKRKPRKQNLSVAAGLGFEPRLTDPELVVLPLHHPIVYERVF